RGSRGGAVAVRRGCKGPLPPGAFAVRRAAAARRLCCQGRLPDRKPKGGAGCHHQLQEAHHAHHGLARPGLAQAVPDGQRRRVRAAPQHRPRPNRPEWLRQASRPRV
ncbi:hypothetical protein IWQ57_005161, partial [Coemansia nantahalensis]